MIADRLRTDNWSNDCCPTGVLKPVFGIPTLPLTPKLCYQKETYTFVKTVKYGNYEYQGTSRFSSVLLSIKINKIDKIRKLYGFTKPE